MRKNHLKFAISLIIPRLVFVVSLSQHPVYDLSHTFEEDMPVWETGVPPEISLVEQDEGHGLRAEHYDFCISEKLGTHITTPSTYIRKSRDANHSHHWYNAENIPLQYLVNVPAVIVDPRAILGNNPQSIIKHIKLNKTHLAIWERQHGRIPHGSFVILRSGWSQFYNYRDKFFGFFADEKDQVFPEFGLEATKWLIENRSIVGIGTECPDIEVTQKGQVKLLLAHRGRFSVMQLANVDSLPNRGFSVTLAPLKLRGGTGGPTRVFAFLDHDKKRHHRSRHQELQNKEELCKEFHFQRQQPLQAYSSANYSSHGAMSWTIILSALLWIY